MTYLWVAPIFSLQYITSRRERLANLNSTKASDAKRKLPNRRRPRNAKVDH